MALLLVMQEQHQHQFFSKTIKPVAWHGQISNFKNQSINYNKYKQMYHNYWLIVAMRVRRNRNFQRFEFTYWTTVIVITVIQVNIGYFRIICRNDASIWHFFRMFLQKCHNDRLNWQNAAWQSNHNRYIYFSNHLLKQNQYQHLKSSLCNFKIINTIKNHKNYF